MNRKELNKKLTEWIKELPQKDKESLLKHLTELKSVFPFNEYEYRLMFLLDKEIISFKEYETLRSDYVGSNPNLHLYGVSPRVFGEIWAQQHLIDIDSRFKKPTKEVDPKYSGEYDLYIKNGKEIIRIEVKASRAINKNVRKGIEETALEFKSKDPYWMNFQQLKLDIVDAFVFVGVWVDKILYWVLSDEEVRNHPLISHQHRGGVEFQIGITNKNIDEFKKFLVSPKQLVSIIKKKL